MDIPREVKDLDDHRDKTAIHPHLVGSEESKPAIRSPTKPPPGADKAYAFKKYTVMPKASKHQRSAVAAAYFSIYTVGQLYLINGVKANGNKKANDEFHSILIHCIPIHFDSVGFPFPFRIPIPTGIHQFICNVV